MFTSSHGNAAARPMMHAIVGLMYFPRFRYVRKVSGPVSSLSLEFAAPSDASGIACNGDRCMIQA